MFLMATSDLVRNPGLCVSASSLFAIVPFYQVLFEFIVRFVNVAVARGTLPVPAGPVHFCP